MVIFRQAVSEMSRVATKEMRVNFSNICKVFPHTLIMTWRHYRLWWKLRKIRVMKCPPNLFSTITKDSDLISGGFRNISRGGGEIGIKRVEVYTQKSRYFRLPLNFKAMCVFYGSRRQICSASRLPVRDTDRIISSSLICGKNVLSACLASSNLFINQKILNCLG